MKVSDITRWWPIALDSSVISTLEIQSAKSAGRVSLDSRSQILSCFRLLITDDDRMQNTYIKARRKRFEISGVNQAGELCRISKAGELFGMARIS